MAAALTNLESGEVAIDSFVNLVLTLDAGNWSENNGGSFYVLLDIVDHDEITA